ncbi:MAG: exodeoxyribonuclease VII large subunit [Bacteroidota bacterium]
MSQDPQVYTVGEVTHYIKHLLEDNPQLKGVQVSGEVSNLTYHRSGHVYFSVKDTDAQLSCVMFKGYAQFAPKMKAGDKVVLKGNMTVYAPRGNYQMMVTSVRKQGVGDLYQQFALLKQKLESEGLFDPAYKQAIPILPQKIAVLTSPTGAAIRDILQTIKRRYNRGEVLVLPTVVQGTQGAASIVKNLKLAQDTGVDVIILGRGGGSLEDLWNFNEETVARAIFGSKIPVVSGVGHETDFTIADFVADVRASTPTAAAETVVPDLAAIIHTVDDYERQLKRGIQYNIDFKRQVLDDYSFRLQQILTQKLQTERHKLEVLEAELKALDHDRILTQGYTLTLKEGVIQHGMEDIEPGDQIETIFVDGRVESEVKQKK